MPGSSIEEVLFPEIDLCISIPILPNVVIAILTDRLSTLTPYYDKFDHDGHQIPSAFYMQLNKIHATIFSWYLSISL